MAHRRYAFPAILASALFAAAGASASPIMNPEIQQCDGTTFLLGPNTHTPNPTVRLSIQDPVGLRVGTSRMGLTTGGTTRALWRFDAAVDVSRSACASSTIDYFYTYQDPNNSDPMTVGHCVYKTGATCTTATATLNSSPQVPIGFACPASTQPVGAGLVSPFTAGAAGTYPSGQFGTAATFTGVEFGSIPYNASFATYDLPGTYTLSAWIKTANAGSQVVLAQRGATGNWGFGINAGGLRSFDSRDVSTSTADITKGSGLANGAWHQITIVRRDGIDRRYYADGKLIGTAFAASTTSFASHSNAAPVIIGADSGGTANFFTGQIDEVRIVATSLTDDDVLLEYAGTVHRYASDGGVVFSTAPGSFQGGTPANGTQSSLFYLPGESLTTPATNSVWLFMAQSTKTETITLPSFSAAIDTGKPIAPAVTAAPTSPSAVTWSWGAPSKICVAPGGDVSPGVAPFFRLTDCGSGALIGQVSDPGRSVLEGSLPGPNQLACRRLSLTDVWGTSPLSAPTSAYTLAAVPFGVTFASSTISTGSFVAAWNANGNPAYTRFEITYALDSGFTAGVATSAAVGDDYRASTIAAAGLLPGTTYYVRVRAFSGRSADFYGGTPTAFATGSVVTIALPPVLTGAPVSNVSMLWSWTQASGATGYTLLDSPTQTQLFAGGGLSKQVNGLAVNTRYDAEIQVDMPPPTPASARAHAFSYTWANAPTGLTASALYHSSATFTWGANGNPAYTYYELVVASEPAFGVVVATLSVSGTTVTASNLFPGATYYAQVHAFNGMQIPTAFAPPLTTATQPDPLTSVSPTPVSPYIPSSGLVGSWQFDEGSGLTTADGSGLGNSGAFVCLQSACSSTPTFAAGPPGLGGAASFSGLSGAVLTASGAPFDFADDLTVEAWVNPQTAALVANSGIVARGAQGSEDFALDVSGVGAYRFTSSGGTSVTVATAAVAVGQWTHVAGVYSLSGTRATLYLNGVPAATTPTAPGRTLHAGQKVSIGNRQDGSGNYTLPFFGRIDAVRVFHRALTAAEVLAEYTGGFVSSVTAPAPNAGVTVALPPNAFSAPAQIYISGDPVGHPIRVPLTALNAGLAQPPAGLTLVPSSLIEVVPVVGGAAFTGTLGSSATLTVPFLDANGDNIVDGTNPPLAVSSMQMYTLNTTVNRWELLPTSVDKTNRRASGLTPHFSVFALFAPTTIGSSLSAVTVYPVPWKPGSGGRFDGPGVSFAHLPSSGHIRILTLAGRRVRDFTYSGADAGTATWNGLNDDGRRTASGVYFAKITSDADRSAVLLKFAIER